MTASCEAFGGVKPSWLRQKYFSEGVQLAFVIFRELELFSGVQVQDSCKIKDNW
jgi:hypothetical protein